MKAMHQSKHMVVAYATVTSTILVTASSTLHNQPLIETPETLHDFALCDDNLAKCKTEQTTAVREALQANHDNVHNLARAVHYKPCPDQESQIDKHVRIEQDGNAPVKKNWSKEATIYLPYHA